MLPFSRIVLKKGKDEALKRFHPWVFSGAIMKITGSVKEGDIVSVYSESNDFLGLGHYQVGTIAVRIFSFVEVIPDFSFWSRKIAKAYSVRETTGIFKDGNDVFRLVHGENDGLPGMVVDFYNGIAVLQFHSIGMYYIRDTIVKVLMDLFGDRLKAVYDKSSKTLPFKAGLNLQDGYLFGNYIPVHIHENGLIFKVNWESGQKTGFFIDQRDNRSLLEKYAYGRDVLNLFSYTGGFSVYALKGGARLVHSVDASAPACEMEKENILLNFPGETRHTAFTSDVVDFIKDIKEKYDLIIIDPPAFSKHRDSVHKALQAYKRLNAKVIESIRPEGIIFTFSCSQVVSPVRFREAIFSGATLTGRNVRILHQLFQPADHPVNLYYPEGEYLKGFVLLVE